MYVFTLYCMYFIFTYSVVSLLISCPLTFYINILHTFCFDQEQENLILLQSISYYVQVVCCKYNIIQIGHRLKLERMLDERDQRKSTKSKWDLKHFWPVFRLLTVSYKCIFKGRQHCFVHQTSQHCLFVPQTLTSNAANNPEIGCDSTELLKQSKENQFPLYAKSGEEKHRAFHFLCKMIKPLQENNTEYKTDAEVIKKL